MSQNTVFITLLADSFALNFFGLWDPVWLYPLMTLTFILWLVTMDPGLIYSQQSFIFRSITLHQLRRCRLTLLFYHRKGVWGSNGLLA